MWLEATNIETGRQMKKLDQKRLGPFPITKVLSNNAYQLRLPSSMRIHPVFHVSKLTPWTPDPIPERKTPTPPPPVMVDDHEEYEVEEILDS